MKKTTSYYLILIFLSIAFSPLTSNAAETTRPFTNVKQTESVEANVLLVRLDEISKMDKTNLNAADKKHLRKEVRSIKQKLNTIGGGGVYISVGAILLIILLVIILT